MSQWDFCDGICSVQTLSNIENGKQAISPIVFQSLTEKCGEMINPYPQFVSLDDFQCAEKMTVQLTGKEPYEISCPFEVNGYEYEIREATACIRANKCRSDRFTPEDSLKVLQLMDDIRESWGMKFTFEE